MQLTGEYSAQPALNSSILAAAGNGGSDQEKKKMPDAGCRMPDAGCRCSKYVPRDCISTSDRLSGDTYYPE